MCSAHPAGARPHRLAPGSRPCGERREVRGRGAGAAPRRAPARVPPARPPSGVSARSPRGPADGGTADCPASASLPRPLRDRAAAREGTAGLGTVDRLVRERITVRRTGLGPYGNAQVVLLRRAARERMPGRYLATRPGPVWWRRTGSALAVAAVVDHEVRSTVWYRRSGALAVRRAHLPPVPDFDRHRRLMGIHPDHHSVHAALLRIVTTELARAGTATSSRADPSSATPRRRCPAGPHSREEPHR